MRELLTLPDQYGIQAEVAQQTNHGGLTENRELTAALVFQATTFRQILAMDPQSREAALISRQDEILNLLGAPSVENAVEKMQLWMESKN